MAEEDAELKELVIQSLENSGVLAKVRVSFICICLMYFYDRRDETWNLTRDVRRTVE